jgi:hypothetical protein
LVALDEQLETHHAAHTHGRGFLRELRPPLVCCHVVDPDDQLLPDRVEARPLLESFLQGVDIFR